jgi:imidazolonepropionase-like amidohydrolase
MFVFVNATVIDGTGAAPRKHQRVLIDGKKILAVGRRINIPKDAAIIDIKGKILMPGLWEGHAHFGGVPVGAGHGLEGTEKSDNFKDMRNMNLKYGITSTRSFGDYQADTLLLRDQIDRGEIRGPKLFCSGKTFCRADSHPACTGWASDEVIMKNCGYIPGTPEEARAMIIEGAEEGLDFFKIIVSSGHISVYPKVLPVIKPEIVEAIIDQAHKLGKPVACHVDTLEQAQMVVDYDADEVHHLIAEGSRKNELPEWEPLFRDMCRKNTWLVPTVAIGFQNEAARLAIGAPDGGVDQKTPVFQMAYEYGVRFAEGSDAGITVMNWGIATYDEIIKLVENVGMTPLEAIRCATYNGAATMNLQGESGIIKAGAYADILILDQDPSVDIRNIDSVNRVLREGVVVYGEDAAWNEDYTPNHDWREYTIL